MTWAKEILGSILLLCWKAIYHPFVFIVSVFSSAAIARLIASFTLDSLYFPAISRYFFDVLLILTIFPYILNDVIIYGENVCLRLAVVQRKVKRISSGGCNRIVQIFLTAYALGISYGLVIFMFNEKLQAPKDETSIIPSPLSAMVAATNVTVTEIWNGIDQVTFQLFRFEFASYIESCFLLASFVPIYCTIRCFNSSNVVNSDSINKKDGDCKMRLHFWYFLRSVACCFKGGPWKGKQCFEYLIAFIFEIAESVYFVILPLFVIFILTKDGEEHAIYSLCKILFGILMSAVLKLTEKALSQSVQTLLHENIQARYLASVGLLYLISIPLFMMYYIDDNALDSKVFWLKQPQAQLQLFISLVAYSAYGCSKLVIRNILPSFTWPTQILAVAVENNTISNDVNSEASNSTDDKLQEINKAEKSQSFPYDLTDDFEDQDLLLP